MNPQTVQLTDEYITYLLTVLRNTNRPMTTPELIQALRSRLNGAA